MSTPKRPRDGSVGNNASLNEMITSMIAQGESRKVLQSYNVTVRLEVEPVFASSKGRACRK